MGNEEDWVPSAWLQGKLQSAQPERAALTARYGAQRERAEEIEVGSNGVNGVTTGGETNTVIDYVAIAHKTMAASEAQAGPASTTGPRHEIDPAEESWAAVRAHANALLNHEGVRILKLDGVLAIGIWSDRDGPHIREALRVIGL